MRSLPLFGSPPLAAVETCGSLPRNPNCTRCVAHETARNRCIDVEGESGGLLTVGLAPGSAEDASGVPDSGPAGRYLREQIARWWSGPVSHTNSVNCKVSTEAITEAMVASCRPYVAGYIERARPTRILALGGLAVQSLLGSMPPIMSVRRGFGWVQNRHADQDHCSTWNNGCFCQPIPVIFLMHPAAGMRNRFVRQAFEEDLEWALTTSDSFFSKRRNRLMVGAVDIIDTALDAAYAGNILRELSMEEGRPLVWDVETRGQLWTPEFRIISLAVCLAGDTTAFVWPRDSIEREDVIQPFLDLLDDPELIFCEQSSYDRLSAMSYWGKDVAGTVRDTRLLRKLLEPDVAADLDVMSYKVGMGGYKGEFEAALQTAIDRCRPKKTKNGAGWDPRQIDMFNECPDQEARKAIYEGFKSGDKHFEPKTWAYALVPDDLRSIYVARDAVSTGLYYEMVWPEIRKRENLAMVWDELTEPASKSYAWMTRWGIKMDLAQIEATLWYAQMQKEQLLPQLKKYVPEDYGEINFDSTAQVAKLIFEYLKVPWVKATKGTEHLPRDKQRPSVDKEAIAALKGKHRFIDVYAVYTHYDTTIEKMSEFKASIRSGGRVHPSYLLDGARSGRPSSQNPNFFNLKRAEDCPDCKGKSPAKELCRSCDGSGVDQDAKRVRDVVVAEDGFTLVELDRKQVEVAVAGNVSNDPVLIKAFADGVDIHSYVASEGSKRSGLNITRQEAKVWVFGTAYDLTASSAARKMGIKVEAAEKVGAIVNDILKVTVAYREKSKSLARKRGWTFTEWRGKLARIRPMWDIASEDSGRRQHAESGSFNNEVQGQANDLTLWAHHKVVEWILAEGLEHDVRLVLSVYDSIMLEVRNELLSWVPKKVASIMEDGYIQTGAIKYRVDCKSGVRWGSMGKLALGT